MSALSLGRGRNVCKNMTCPILCPPKEGSENCRASSNTFYLNVLSTNKTPGVTPQSQVFGCFCSRPLSISLSFIFALLLMKKTC